MNFVKHSNLQGQHAFLGASKYHWLNYDDEKLVASYNNYYAAQNGSELHDLAARCIKKGIKLEKTHQTINMFVNDAIGFRMTPEQPLYYSDNCFGTADAISFNRNFLRIHDYKSGVIPANMAQLRIYAALFCLEYKYKPSAIKMELRIYQSDDVIIERPSPEDIQMVMDKIVHADRIISNLKKGV